MARALKVYRTAIGFHDAYVAAPTQKAALEAWGADRNLFASGRAEIVDDPKLTRVPLTQPGKVVKVLRGTTAEQFAALGKSPTRRKRSVRSSDSAPKSASRPSRALLDKAERALESAKDRHESALAALARREEGLRAERRALQRARDEEIARREREREAAQDAYDDAMREWRG